MTNFFDFGPKKPETAEKMKIFFAIPLAFFRRMPYAISERAAVCLPVL